MYESGVEAFLAVISCHSISGAAKLLNLTSSAVSHRLRNFEDQLEMILIDRQKGVRRCNLTQAGEMFLPIAERWMNLSQETQRIKAKVEAFSLVLGCVDSFSTFIMPPLYKALVTHTPPVYLKLYGSTSLDMYRRIERREMDIAFPVQEISHQHLNVKPFYHESMQVVRLSRRKKLSPIVCAEELDPEDELTINWSPSHQIWHDRVWDSSHMAKIHLDSVHLINFLMDDPQQWAIIPKSVADFFCKNKKLTIQNLDPPPPDRITYMVTHRFPRLGAHRGIEILEKLAGELKIS
jgi:LysR family transcriptional regulator, transcriptional activator of the cysJI operon